MPRIVQIGFLIDFCTPRHLAMDIGWHAEVDDTLVIVETKD